MKVGGFRLRFFPRRLVQIFTRITSWTIPWRRTLSGYRGRGIAQEARLHVGRSWRFRVATGNWEKVPPTGHARKVGISRNLALGEVPGVRKPMITSPQKDSPPSRVLERGPATKRRLSHVSSKHEHQPWC